MCLRRKLPPLGLRLGHSSIKVTFELYGHLMPGAEAEAAQLLDAYLRAGREEADNVARPAVDDLTSACMAQRIVS